MQKLKLSKSITMTIDNIMVVEQMMSKTKQNFSRTLDYILGDWVKVRTMLRQNKMVDQQEEVVSKQLHSIKTAKVIHE